MPRRRNGEPGESIRAIRNELLKKDYEVSRPEQGPPLFSRQADARRLAVITQSHSCIFSDSAVGVSALFGPYLTFYRASVNFWIMRLKHKASMKEALLGEFNQ